MRSRLERVCPDCQLRLPRPAARCPFCARPTIPLDAARDDASLRRPPRWALARTARAVRWLVAIGGSLLLLPVPAAAGALIVTHFVFGSAAPQRLEEDLFGVLIGVPGLVLAWTLTVVLVGALVLLPAALPLAVVEAVRGRQRGVRASARTRPPGLADARPGHRVDALLHRLERGMGRVDAGQWKRYALGGYGMVLAGGSIAFLASRGAASSTVLVGLLASAFSTLLVGFAGAAWWETVAKGVEWVRAGPGLARRPHEQGRQGFDAAGDAEALLGDWKARRAARRGSARPLRPVTPPLGGEPVLAYRVRGRVGRWSVDEVAVAPFALEGGGAAAWVETDDWALPLETPAPAPVERSDALAAWLAARGLPDEAPIVLAQATVPPGARVAVWGTEAGDAPLEAGYRGRRVPRLGADEGADARPVVVEVEADEAIDVEVVHAEAIHAEAARRGAAEVEAAPAE